VRRTMPITTPRAMFARLIDHHACDESPAPANRRSHQSNGSVAPGPQAEVG
jgi:hypothetical protein